MIGVKFVEEFEAIHTDDFAAARQRNNIQQRRKLVANKLGEAILIQRRIVPRAPHLPCRHQQAETLD